MLVVCGPSPLKMAAPAASRSPCGVRTGGRIGAPESLFSYDALSNFKWLSKVLAEMALV
jgi:hypothetical protein